MTNIDVRKIVLDVVEANPSARQAFLLEPQMRHGVEITIGVLDRAARVLNTTGGHTREETARLIRAIAVACSHSGGQEDVAAIAIANGQLHPEQARRQWQGTEFHGAQWTAVLAPLDVPGEDDRRLAADFTLTPSTFPVPLRDDTPSGRIIGTVAGAEIRDGRLIAHGTVDDPVAAMRMGAGELRPQMELVAYQQREGAFTTGTLREIRAGRRPVWVKCRFTLGGAEATS